MSKTLNIRFILPVAIITLFCYSCHKVEYAHFGGYFAPYTTLPKMPYDTSNVAGCFICERENIGHIDLFASFFVLNGAQKNGIANVLKTNDSLRTGFGGSAYNGCYFSYSDFATDSFIYWKVIDTTTFSFTFGDTATPPYISIASDTITGNSGTAQLITAFTNTDSIGVTINDSLHYYGAASDTINLDLSSFGIAMGTQANISIAITAYRHQIVSISGYNYLFIKDYQLQQNVWLK